MAIGVHARALGRNIPRESSNNDAEFEVPCLQKVDELRLELIRRSGFCRVQKEIAGKDAAAAARELDEALGRLQEESVRRQLDALLEKDRNVGLTTEEKHELQQLMQDLARPG